MIQPSDLKSQNISTIGEVYDFEVGDLFHFDKSAGDLTGWSGMWSVTNIEILDKYNSSNDDTLFYIRNISRQRYDYPDNVLTYSYNTDTIFFINLNSLLQSGNIDSVYTNVNLYNGRIINFVDLSYSNALWTMKYANGCGKTSEQFYSEDFNSESSYELVYFKKGSEEWGTPIIVSVENSELIDSEILIFPNPSKNSVKIVSNKSDYGELTIISMNGIKIKSFQLNPYQTTIDISELKQGIYILQMYINSTIISKRLIKE